ncbi:MAG: DUF2812 domain-containing protein [Clostridia bacterium]|nr:DUF2812 domain-containing protein [Clostridia bacterium]NCC43873.1 DUF2812 domain-containing protein [Clostridia bacterium]
MKEDNIKRELHWFFLTDYEAEEEFLSKKSKEGYRLVSVWIPGIYTFEACEPEDIIYRLEFKPLAESDKAEYLKIYEDYGWEYVTEINDYCYFRKPQKDIKSEVEAEIFNDTDSKLDMLKAIFCKKMIPLLCIFLLCGLPSVNYLFKGIYNGVFGDAYSIIWGIIFLIYLCVFIHCSIGFYRLRKKYRHE